jgi:hypothetical protein
MELFTMENKLRITTNDTSELPEAIVQELSAEESNRVIGGSKNEYGVWPGDITGTGAIAPKKAPAAPLPPKN